MTNLSAEYSARTGKKRVVTDKNKEQSIKELRELDLKEGEKPVKEKPIEKPIEKPKEKTQKQIEDEKVSELAAAKGKTESEILNASSKMKDSYKKLRKLDSEMDKIFEKFDKMAKDLGVDVRSTKVGKTYLEAAEEIQNYQIKSQTAESKLRKFKI